ncbi:hypothetical protein J2D73_12380 [Acetobacter sacchari]|uniref:Uncharacterized protein n=1 Tax=Acetobacter sacchari TaxID=2661687 RepID=A0ABS3LXD2_9PROT|nr:hypothetical protein [Acetobacter sacchari]MBO1360585.1 hypothetical protein [Acetobacter sacchari]
MTNSTTPASENFSCWRRQKFLMKKQTICTIALLLVSFHQPNARANGRERHAETIRFLMKDPELGGASSSIILTIPRDFFEDGVSPATESTADSALLFVTWPSWTTNNDPSSSEYLRILLEPTNTSFGPEKIVSGIMKAFISDRAHNRQINFDLGLRAPQVSSLDAPYPSGYGLREITRYFPTANDDPIRVENFILGEATQPKSFLRCDKMHLSNAPQCQYWFVYKEILVKLTFDRKYVSDFYKMELTTKEHLDVFLNPDSTKETR